MSCTTRTRAPLTSFLNCRVTFRCLAVGTFTCVPSCTTLQSRAPLRNLVQNCVISCTSRAPSCTTHTTLVHCSCALLTSFLNCRGTSHCLAIRISTHIPLCTTPQSRAPLRNLVHHRAPLCNLVHHYIISCTIVHHSCSCTTAQSRAPLHNLVHLSCTVASTRTTLVHCSRAPLTSFLNCRGTSRCLAVGTSTRVPSCSTPQDRAPLRNLVHSRAPFCTTCAPSFLNCRGTSHCLAVGSHTQEASSTLVHHSNTHNSHC